MHVPTANLIRVLSLIACLTTGTVRAQESSSPSRAEYAIDYWRVEQGLPHDTVTALLQTRDRYLWIGTAEGLARFDGLEFSRVSDADVPELGQARITALVEDREGGIWIGTQGNGLFRLQDGACRQYAAIDGLSEPDITAVAEGPDGRIWIGTLHGLCYGSGETLSRFTSAAMPPGEPILGLHAGRSGTVWVTTHQAVYQVIDNRVAPFEVTDLPPGRSAGFIGVYETASGDLWAFGATFLLKVGHETRINYFPSLDPASSRVWTLCEQDDAAFWIGTSGRGLFKFRDGRFEIVGVGDGLDQCDIRALRVDDEGNLWIGTSGRGLARLRTRPWRWWGSELGLDVSRVTALARDASGRLVVGTANAGVMVLRDRRFEPLAVDPPLGFATHIHALCRDGAGRVWVAAEGAGLLRVAGARRQWQFTTADGLGDTRVRALAAEPEGVVVWAGTESGTLHRFTADGCRTWNEADGLSGRPIRCLRVATDGSLWIGAESGGLVRWDGRRLVAENAPPALTHHPVRCLYEDQAGRVWACTDGAGVYCRTESGWVGLDMATGLASDRIVAIHQDPVGRYWFSSDRGLFQVPAASMRDWLAGTAGEVTCMRTAPVAGDVHHPGEPTRSGAMAAIDDRLWVASGAGLMEMDPVRIRTAIPPRVVIERVRVNGKDVPVSDLSRLSRPPSLGPGAGSLDIEFAAVTFAAPERTQFRRRLSGIDPDWTAADPARRAHYGPLPPGHYRFEVRATDAGGAINEPGAVLAWTVARPIWASWWFLLPAGGGGIVAIWSAIHFISLRQLRAQLRRSEHRQAMERERSRIARDMHDEIGSKLTRISFLSEVACRDEAPPAERVSPIRAIAHTSRELLQALDEIVWVVNPRNDTLVSLAGYLEEYAHQYFQGTELACEVTVDPAVDNAPLPAELRHNVFLAFKESLGNVLKHASARRVEIHMQPSGSRFEIAVQDDGTGLTDTDGAAPPGHDGLRNMKLRLDAAGGDCTIESVPGRGTRILLRFPLGVPADE